MRLSTLIQEGLSLREGEKDVIQIRIGELHGVKRAQYRHKMANGEWSNDWHRMSVQAAKKALDWGTTDLGGNVGDVKVVNYDWKDKSKSRE